MYQRIVVPLDGSALSKQALPEAQQMAELTHAPIHLLQVVDVTRTPWYGQLGMAMEYSAAEDALKEVAVVATHELEAVAFELQQKGIAATIEVRHGSAAQEIINAVQAGDLLVLATHGRSGMIRWFLGSIAEEVLRNSTVPIMLIRVAETAAQAPPLLVWPDQEPVLANGTT